MEGRLIRRYKRFLADVELPDGSVITAHTPNTGSMMGCSDPGCRVWLRDTQNLKRKYPLSWEMVETLDGIAVGIHTGYANDLVEEAIRNGVIHSLQDYQNIRREVRFADFNTRFDLFLSEGKSTDCFVEVKNVTAVENGCAIFPDAVTARGTKHLNMLAEVVKRGQRAVLCFCVQREDANSVAAAEKIDPLYAQTLKEVITKGVEVIAYQAKISPQEITLIRELPVKFSS